MQGLETVEYQISRFDTMTMEQQDRMLAETLKELETETATVGKLGDAWKAGDVPAIEQIALADLKIRSADVPAAARRAEQELDAEDRGAVRASRHGRWSSSAPRIWSAPTACSRCSRRRATRSSSCSHRGSTSRESASQGSPHATAS